MCWNAVKSVQMPGMWNGKPSPCAEKWSRHQGQSWLLRALGCRALWTPRVATWPGAILPSGRAVQERRHLWNFGKSWLFVKTWRGWTERRLQTPRLTKEPGSGSDQEPPSIYHHFAGSS